MKNLLPLIALFVSLGLASPLAAQTSAAPKTEREKLGYALGADVGSTIKGQGFDIDTPAFLAAVKDSLTGGQMAMSNDQIKEVLTDFTNKMRAKQAAAAGAGGPGGAADGGAAAAKNKATGAAFLAANKGKAGVKTFDDGLQYKVVNEGSGPSPKSTDTVTVKYRGTLIDGTEFDASEKHGGTATFPVDGVIKGWTEALQKMKPGSKWQLFIPSELAYGDRAVGGDIQPGSTLIFDVELVSIGK